MNTRAKTLAANLFGPSLVTPQMLFFKGEVPGKVISVVELDHPQVYTLTVGGDRWSSSYTQVFTEIRVKTGDVVMPGAVLGLTRGYLIHQLEAVRSYTFESYLERAQLLLEIVRYWAGKPVVCFCNGEGSLHRFDYKKWLVSDEKTATPLGWKSPSTCSSCRATREILEAVLGSQIAPFVISKGNRRFKLNLVKLMTFVEEGPEVFAAAEQRKYEETARARWQGNEDEVTKALKGAEVGDKIRAGLNEDWAKNGSWDGVKAVSRDLVVSYRTRSEWGKVGGIGKFDEVRVWYKGQSSLQEWQWRDRYNPNADRFDLRVGGIGNVVITYKEGKVEIRLEIQNGEHSRFATYTFEEE